MILNVNRLASAALAVLCAARVYQRLGWEAALTALGAVACIVSLIWYGQFWANRLRNSSFAARHAIDRDRPQSATAVALIGWILLLLVSYALF